MNEGSFQRSNPILGSPQSDASFVDGQQSLVDSCAVRCQEYILQMFHGCDYDEQVLVAEAFEHGWYSPGGGTTIEDLGKLLELYGVDVNRFTNASIFHLSNELAQGHKVIIAVDSSELWNNGAASDSNGGADHAIVVSGIDTSDPGDIHVLVSDPGTGSGAARYPLAQFLNAWEDGGFTMVATQQPAPYSAPGMENFPFDEGHLPYVLDMPYDQFASYASRSPQWSSWLQREYDIDETQASAGESEHVAPAVSPESWEQLPELSGSKLVDGATANVPCLDQEVHEQLLLNDFWCVDPLDDSWPEWRPSGESVSADMSPQAGPELDDVKLGWSYQMEIDQAKGWMEYQTELADWAAWRGDAESAAFHVACAEDWLDTANYYMS